MPTDPEQVNFLDIEFDNLSYEEVAARLELLSKQDHFSYVVTPNVDHVVRLNDSSDGDVTQRFRQAYAAAHLRLCDSRILQLLARLSGKELRVVTGSDLTAYLFDHDHLDGCRVALIGGNQALLLALQSRYRKVELIQHCPPMGVISRPDAIAEIVSFLAQSDAAYVFFAFGAPQSEIVAHACLEDQKVRGVGLCIGASLEFIVGEKKRAPRWIQVARLEWIFRLLNEPRRLWRRYLLEGPRILLILGRQSIKRH